MAITSETPILNYVPITGGGPPSGGAGVLPGFGSFVISQTAHGFVVGNVVRLSGSSYTLAKADNAVDAEVIGIVSGVPDANTFVLTTVGKVGGLSGFTAGTTYFLSDTTAGALSASEPITAGKVSKPLFVADSATSGYFNNWRGMVVPAVITAMTLQELDIGTDLRLVPVAGGGKLQARNTTTGLWADVDQWSNP